jgi:predicted DNA-binding protein with PD1-like motif
MMKPHPIRLSPGNDLRRALESAVAASACSAAFVLSGIGSLGATKLRLAGADDAIDVIGDVEILTLAGSIATGASHLHASVADAAGRVLGGHVAYGCIVRTSAVVLLVLLPDQRFSREFDPNTGYEELVIRPR